MDQKRIETYGIPRGFCFAEMDDDMREFER